MIFASVEYYLLTCSLIIKIFFIINSAIGCFFIIIVSLFTHCNTAKSIKMVQIVIKNIQIIQ